MFTTNFCSSFYFYFAARKCRLFHVFLFQNIPQKTYPKLNHEIFKLVGFKTSTTHFPFYTEQMAGNHSKLTDKYIAGRGRALKEFARRTLKAEVRNFNYFEIWKIKFRKVK